jgi:glycine hydroxymethyltransferase
MKDIPLEKLVENEIQRQEQGLVMIPSENLSYKYPLSFLSTELNNKYSEGYPGKRYYTGNKYIDEIETLAIERAKELFNAEHANVQPLAGANANYAALSAVLAPGEKILSMQLNSGGHLSHGLKINYSGKLYEIVHYDVDEQTECLDYENIQQLAEDYLPKLIISGASSYPREIDFDKITEIAHSVGALHLADISHVAGLIAAGAHKSAETADLVTFTTHKTLRGPRGAVILCKEKFAGAVDRAVFPGLQGGPFEAAIAAKAAVFEYAKSPEFTTYQQQIVKNAKTLEQAFLAANLRLVSGGTDTHLLLIDVRNLNIDGAEGAVALEEAGIYTNMNVIPFETGSPRKPSGVRLGTPYLTARGMGDAEMITIAGWISKILKNTHNHSFISDTAQKVKALTTKFPLYGSQSL